MDEMQSLCEDTVKEITMLKEKIKKLEMTIQELEDEILYLHEDESI